MSLAGPLGGTRLYVLGEITGGTAAAPTKTPTLWRIADITVAAPAAATVAGVPAALWGRQRDYDQALAVMDAAGTDRVFLGGSTVQPLAGGQWSASLWCFDVNATPALVPAPRVSQTGVPTTAASTAAGADQAGLIGNNVHADVHSVRVVRPGGGTPDQAHVWVGCDGGVFASAMGGRVNSFAARAVGLATLEAGYVTQHPTSSHYVAVGVQDNGTLTRVGETVWEAFQLGDGGGLAFHPVHAQYLVTQYTNAGWKARPTAGFVGPLFRTAGGSTNSDDRESKASRFYSGMSAIRASATVGRMAIGTNRVWISDDVGGATNTWGVIPHPSGTRVDPRTNGTDPVPLQGAGVPPGVVGAGGVVQLRWASPSELLALYPGGIVRHVEDPVTRVWTSTIVHPGAIGGPSLASNPPTDIWPIAGTRDFYLTTVGDQPGDPALREDTCWFYEQATNTMHATGLRRELDQAGTPGPLDPAQAVVVDPTATDDVYVGTVTGVWNALRLTPGLHLWSPFVNGLPQATVQDLAIWTDPSGAADAPRLLRAAMQSRGLWEVNLAATEARRTYVRVHRHDDRRRFPTPLANPELSATGTPHPVVASPDVVVRPRAPRAAAPAWPFGASVTMTAANVN
jgi:hypothetical protein